MATLKDVAQLAGVNISTVSRALAGSPSISAATAQRVRAAADQLGYHPNLSARALSGKRTGVVALAVQDIMSPVWALLCGGVCDTVAARGGTVMLFTAQNESDYRERVLPALRSCGADGAVLALLFLDQQLQQLTEETGIKAVLAECRPRAGIPSVYADREEASYRACRHLIDVGCRDIALVTAPWFDHSYIKGCDRAAGGEVPHRVYSGEPTYQAGYQLGLALAADGPLPQGLVTVCDEQALGLQHAFLQNGVQVPQDCSVISLEDSMLAVATWPQLTAVSKPLYRIGARAADMLLDMLDGKTAASQVVHHQLTVRQSTSLR